mmetsp:Transcript_130768/g.226263  ORF Transcript_130768/g.226263 Transcript_130768/m.226263 type:complete len:90 (+) Transcript_130768:888-1157(+)
MTNNPNESRKKAKPTETVMQTQQTALLVPILRHAATCLKSPTCSASKTAAYGGMLEVSVPAHGADDLSDKTSTAPPSRSFTVCKNGCVV